MVVVMATLMIGKDSSLQISRQSTFADISVHLYTQYIPFCYFLGIAAGHASHILWPSTIS